MEAAQLAVTNKYIVLPFFVSFHVVCVLLVLNLVVALIVTYYELKADKDEVSEGVLINLEQEGLSVELVPSTRFSTLGWRKELVEDELLSLTTSEVKYLLGGGMNSELDDPEKLKEMHSDVMGRLLSMEKRRQAAVTPLALRSLLKKMIPGAIFTNVMNRSIVFRSLSSVDTLTLIENTRVVMCTQGDVIVQENENMNKVYLIATGLCQAMSSHAIVRPGDIFQESLLLLQGGQQYTEELIASTNDVVVLEWDYNQVTSVMKMKDKKVEPEIKKKEDDKKDEKKEETKEKEEKEEKEEK
eukprot:CAMPEP_0201516990 /NCGR_PEP_ID=MMETSP0161_2-20130828/8216_1 /ASSEMBLY_ACC=CAM_ASM_000251 /TAXON_ID=180227 /ORGANISM="Neoparamoeba aestuarina, Strain SoJaBio B1-5/56/2" /LENGTH=298 /DNA_ID=CAMNT_0047914361 /DNA_START=368 /DNA_END=1261 /DNA_ORIENTATION=+